MYGVVIDGKLARLISAAVATLRRSTSSSAAVANMGRALTGDQLLDPVPPDITVAQSVEPLPINDIAAAAGVLPHELFPVGQNMAKVKLSVMERLANQSHGHYVLVAGVTPTPLGEGKSTTVIGLTQALGAHLNK